MVGILGIMVGVFDVLAGVFLIQSSPFRVPCRKKVRWLEKKYANAVGALLTNIKYASSVVFGSKDD